MKAHAFFAALSMPCAVLLGCDDKPRYALDLRLVADGGTPIERHLSTGRSRAYRFPCELTLRLGQCIDAFPVQVNVVAAASEHSGSSACVDNLNANAIVRANVGKPLALGRGDAGALWLEVVLGEDDNLAGGGESGQEPAIEQHEMRAQADLTRGTLTVSVSDQTEFIAEVDAQDDSGQRRLRGTLAAIAADSARGLISGPQCTWPIEAKAN